MNFEEQLISQFVQRIKSGQNIESAVSFKFTDFPNVSREEISDFCAMGNANIYYYGFGLKRNYAVSILEDYDLL
jgi:hypothetical protein